MWPIYNSHSDSISRPGLALAGTAFHRNDCPCGETIQGGMGDLESRRPSGGGGLFTFGHEYRNELLLSVRLRLPLPAPAEQT
jgi:hypothetical protein